MGETETRKVNKIITHLLFEKKNQFFLIEFGCYLIDDGAIWSLIDCSTGVTNT